MPPGRLMNDDETLAYENLQAAFHKLRTTDALSNGQKDQLEGSLEALFWRALPYFRMRPDVNPVQHHTQVLDNMVGITLGELPDGSDSRMLLSAYVLGLLHDIGNGICESQKITTDKTDAITDQARECPDPAHRKTLEREAVRIALQAVAFRLEHMDKGPALIRDAVVAAQIAGLVAAYVARKRQIVASGVTDSLDYCYAKGEFVRDVLGNAVSRSKHV